MKPSRDWHGRGSLEEGGHIALAVQDPDDFHRAGEFAIKNQVVAVGMASQATSEVVAAAADVGGEGNF
jgi:hypothetical protein